LLQGGRKEKVTVREANGAVAESHLETKFYAYSGNSITILGLVKYDVESDTFGMTEISSMIAGG